MNKNLYCQLCNYKTNRTTDWLRHIKSNRHLRQGTKKISKCEECDIVFASHCTLKHHILTTHSTKEERSKSKYYCETCDYVFISKLYYDKHMNGIKHKNQELVKQSLIDIQNKLDQ